MTTGFIVSVVAISVGISVTVSALFTFYLVSKVSKALATKVSQEIAKTPKNIK